ncbi:MAG: DUF4440 domain-containing protein [Myxococcales bacterium]|nr:DUF4440 domain-containing protein [Myxococcales bacterium]MCB9754828.1 DUF4440 domain-containing protein [Myxococcales bacterium]
MEEVYSAIQAKNYNLAAAFGRGDAAAVAAVYGEDAVLMPPNMEMFRGRAAIQSFWQRGISMGFGDIKLEPLEVDAREDMAYEIGRFQRQIKSVRGNTITQGGKYVTLWRRTPHGWTAERDIWNATGPIDLDIVERPSVLAGAPEAMTPVEVEPEPIEPEAIEAVEIPAEPVYEVAPEAIEPVAEAAQVYDAEAVAEVATEADEEYRAD